MNGIRQNDGHRHGAVPLQQIFPPRDCPRHAYGMGAMNRDLGQPLRPQIVGRQRRWRAPAAIERRHRARFGVVKKREHIPAHPRRRRLRHV